MFPDKEKFIQWASTRESEPLVEKNDNICGTCVMARFLTFHFGKTTFVGLKQFWFAGNPNRKNIRMPDWATKVSKWVTVNKNMRLIKDLPLDELFKDC